MALVTLNPLLSSAHGRFGDVVFVFRRGRQHLRPYVIPRNPDTVPQRARRGAFRDAVRQWQFLPEEEKRRWRRRAAGLPMSGYNLFISRTLRERENETAPPVQSTICLPSPLLRFAETTGSPSPLHGIRNGSVTDGG